MSTDSILPGIINPRKTTENYYLKGRVVDGVEEFQYADDKHVRFGPVFPSMDTAESTRLEKGLYYLRNFKP